MPKNTVLQRFLKTGYFSNIPHTIEDVLRVKPNLRFSRKPVGAHRQPKFLKGVGRDGNYYRLKIPPRRRPLPRIPKLPKGQQQISPKPLSPPPPPPESAAEILGYKRRLFKWLLGNLPVLVLNFGRYAIEMLQNLCRWQLRDHPKVHLTFFSCPFSIWIPQYMHIASIYSI